MENYLKHYGVKGMKWGVRRDRALDSYDKAQRYLTKAAGGKKNRATAYAAQGVARTWASKKPSTIQKMLYTGHVARVLKKDLNTDRKKMEIGEKDLTPTRITKTDWNNMSDLEFRAAHKVSKNRYERRVNRSITGDPLRSVRGVAVTALNAKYYADKISNGKRVSSRYIR